MAKSNRTLERDEAAPVVMVPVSEVEPEGIEPEALVVARQEVARLQAEQQQVAAALQQETDAARLVVLRRTLDELPTHITAAELALARLELATAQAEATAAGERAKEARAAGLALEEEHQQFLKRRNRIWQVSSRLANRAQGARTRVQSLQQRAADLESRLRAGVSGGEVMRSRMQPRPSMHVGGGPTFDA